MSLSSGLETDRKSTSCFGYNPCLCFHATCSVEELEDQKKVVMLRVRDVASKDGNINHDIFQLLHLYQQALNRDRVTPTSPNHFLQFLQQKDHGSLQTASL